MSKYHLELTILGCIKEENMGAYLEAQRDSAITWGNPYPTEEEFEAHVNAGEDIMGLDNSIISGIRTMIEIGGTGHDAQSVLGALKAGDESPLREIGTAMQKSGISGAAMTYKVGAGVHTGWVAENLYRMDKKIEQGNGGQYDQFGKMGHEEQAKDVLILKPFLETAGIDTRGWESVAAHADSEPVKDFVDKVAVLAPDYKNYKPEQVEAFAKHHGVDPESVGGDTEKVQEDGVDGGNVETAQEGSVETPQEGAPDEIDDAVRGLIIDAVDGSSMDQILEAVNSDVDPKDLVSVGADPGLVTGAMEDNDPKWDKDDDWKDGGVDGKENEDEDEPTPWSIADIHI